MAEGTVYRYRYWCITENAYVYKWDEDDDHECPHGADHVIDATKTTVVDTIESTAVDISPVLDELDRPFVRADSRDDHDTTYFTMIGDKWTAVSAENVGTGNGIVSAFYLDYKEVKGVKMYLDSVQTTAFSVDYSTYINGNQASHFCRGLVTFAEPPVSGAAITADYMYATIGKENSNNTLSFDFSGSADTTKTLEVVFCDPAHIKDGVVYFQNGEMDSTLDIYLMCPAGGYYRDNNGNIGYAFTEVVLSHYVVKQIMNGTADMGIYYDVEARSTAVPPGYFVRAVVNKGSANELRGCIRLEINRERTVIL